MSLYTKLTLLGGLCEYKAVHRAKCYIILTFGYIEFIRSNENSRIALIYPKFDGLHYVRIIFLLSNYQGISFLGGNTLQF